MSLLDTALQFYGYTEESNAKHVLECLSFCDDLSKEDKSTTDTPWCAAGLCKVLDLYGKHSPRSASAASFLSYGTEVEVSKLLINDIVVLHRVGGNHVTLFVNRVNNRLFNGYGANQSNGWFIKQYEYAHIRGVRRI